MDLLDLGISDKKSKQFKTKGIEDVEGLIRFIPIRYDDFTKETGILPEGMSCVIVKCGRVRYVNGKKGFISAECYTKNSDTIHVSWFHQDFIYQRILSMTGLEILLCGRITCDTYYRGDYACSSPVIFSPGIQENMKLYPIYSKIRGMGEDYLLKSVEQALSICQLEDDIPEDLLSKYGMPELNEAYRMLHRPLSMSDVDRGMKRLDFDDIMYFTLKSELASKAFASKSPFKTAEKDICFGLVEKLPYKLTKDQASVIREMTAKAEAGSRISALLQGDVGCGKSIVAFLMAALFVENGYQAAIMAPTQVLARQHYTELLKLLKGTGINTGFYEGTKMKAAEKRAMLKSMASGEISIAVGTHALLDPSIKYNKLAITIVDEEHKFGVLQKEALVKKASEGVHSITMSATPIPRSLSQVMYGSNTDVYTIKEMPAGRHKIKSCVTSDRRLVNKFINDKIKEGRQVYIVCPAIEKNDTMENVRSVEELNSMYRSILKDARIKTLTGKDKKDDVAATLDSFNKGETDILISTTVVEVGVNVPNATIMVIENAERFGLAALHQLRGRVGRGKEQGYCIFFSESEDNPRLEVITSTTDGFKIAEEDMKLRGAGEFIGTRQSGEDRYITTIFSSEYNREMYKKLKADAPAILRSGKADKFISHRDATVG